MMPYPSDIPEKNCFLDDFRPSETGVAGIEPALKESKSFAFPFGYTPTFLNFL